VSHEDADVFRILDAGMLCHIAYVIDGQPFCTPTLYWRVGDRIYWHGSSASRMLRAQHDRLPVCLTVSHLDGLVLARCGFNHSVNYRAAMCFGTAAAVDDPGEKAQALHAMLERFYPGRDGVLRPMTAQELKATGVVGMTIEEASAKVRAKMNADEPDDLSVPLWAGVVPVSTVIGPRQPCPHNLPGAREDGVTPYAPGLRLDEVFARLAR
jgi:nitroimidazol reductase NimA-like FMN-containing flavoprotein (pyridoxamine 5'-phosphate oxidase superfamily)